MSRHVISFHFQKVLHGDNAKKRVQILDQGSTWVAPLLEYVRLLPSLLIQVDAVKSWNKEW